MSRFLLIFLAILGLPMAAFPNEPPRQEVHSRYQGPVSVDFVVTSEQSLKVTIRTDRLLIRSLEPRDLRSLIDLFGDPVATEKYATGKTYTPDEVTERFITLSDRWRNMDPFSGFVITRIDNSLPQEEYPFLGVIVLGYGKPEGVSSLGYLFHPSSWHHGYGIEAVTAIVRHYAYALYLKGYTVRGYPLQQIVATSRPDNIASIHILESVGMEYTGTSQMYGSERYHYAIDVYNTNPEK